MASFSALTAVAAFAIAASAQVTKPPIPGSPQIITNGRFANGTFGWESSPAGTIRNGLYCVDIPAGATGNSSYLRTQYTFLETKNDVYTLNFTASSSVGYTILVQTPDAPLDPNLNQTAALTTVNYPFSMTFSPANQAPEAYLEFILGGSPSAATVCIGDVSMKRIDRSGFRQDYGPAIKLNQLGFLPGGPKLATVVTNSTSSEHWTLRNSAGDPCATGNTVYRGLDGASNQTVSIIDFSSFNVEGNDYTLSVGSSTSYPFSISSTLYHDLQQDALRFFYQQRSGIAIDGDLVGQQYARAAGHVQVPPNQGDVAVPCQAVHDSLIAYLEPWTCNYTLDVTKGWYDAGDQGKYVVNGGLAAAQLMMQYERSIHYGRNVSDRLGDGSLRIPERNNGVPDILDEARWEVEFLMKMQVPANSTPQLFNGSYIDMSGLVHHKMHDNQWTPLPTDPAHDPKRRELHRPSTAAALNLAASGAQAARLFKSFDSAFAARALTSARTAYAAARRHPAIYGPGTDWDLGGGAYSDNNVTDEFYWAAAELYLRSASVTDIFINTGGFSWASTAAVGRLELASVPSNYSGRAAAAQSVAEAAEMFLSIQQRGSNGYGTYLYTYPWGSNSNQMNIVQIVATAADITGNATLRSAALEGIDYIFGRNTLAQSYVRGYGSKDSQNIHSRLYAHELDAQVPQAPPGALAGGANQDASDPPADDVLQGCAPQSCYVDDVNSYSTNEVAINWNSALSWVIGWAASQ